MSYSVYDKKEQCCGCTACLHACPKGAISMVADEEGFLYPSVNEEKCVECELCKKVCAFQKETPSLGKAIAVYAAKASKEIREKSSSGGLFTVLSDKILENGGVVYGAAFDKNFKAVHIRAEEKGERDRCRGSKYSQSELGDTFAKIKEDLRIGREVLFTGTTCQTAALLEYLSKENTEKLYTADIICHGTPSPKLFKEFITRLEQVRGKKIAAYYHRPKELGWQGGEKVVYTNGATESGTPLVDAWRNIFYSELALRPSCYQCRYAATVRPSDLTIADFWGIDDCAPQFNDQKGISLAIIGSEKGKALFDACSGSLEILERSMEEAVAKNPNLLRPTAKPEGREAFWQLYQREGFSSIIKIYGKDHLKQKIRYGIKGIIRAIGLLELVKKMLKK